MNEQAVISLLGASVPRGGASSIRLRLADAVSKGLSVAALDRVRSKLQMTEAEIALLLGISKRTISRLQHRPQRPLDLVLSDRLCRMAVAYTMAREVLEGDVPARTWLRESQPGLGNRTPLELLITEAGAREVEDLLGRIEFGVLT